MTVRSLLLVGAATALALTMSTTALAQNYGGNVFRGSSDNPVGPTVSPYLNLLQQSPGAPTNYQSLVKPLINQNDAINRQAGSISRLQQQVYSGATGRATGGGHTSYFMYYSHFYRSPQQ